MSSSGDLARIERDLLVAEARQVCMKRIFGSLSPVEGLVALDDLKSRVRQIDQLTVKEIFKKADERWLAFHPDGAKSNARGSAGVLLKMVHRFLPVSKTGKV